MIGSGFGLFWFGSGHHVACACAGTLPADNTGNASMLALRRWRAALVGPAPATPPLARLRPHLFCLAARCRCSLPSWAEALGLGRAPDPTSLPRRAFSRALGPARRPALCDCGGESGKAGVAGWATRARHAHKGSQLSLRQDYGASTSLLCSMAARATGAHARQGDGRPPPSSSNYIRHTQRRAIQVTSAPYSFGR